MLRHLFVGPTLPGCTGERLSDVVNTLRELPGLVPWIRDFSVDHWLGCALKEGICLHRHNGGTFIERHDRVHPSRTNLPDTFFLFLCQFRINMEIN
jgi:hypothetical protein